MGKHHKNRRFPYVLGQFTLGAEIGQNKGIVAFPGSDRIRLNFQIQDVQLKSKTLVNLDIILNELLTNAMKYAFNGKKEGKLLVELEKTDDQFRLVFADDGVGFSRNHETHAPTGFGFTLVDALTAQLGGRVSIDGSRGTRVVLDFPE